MRLLLATQKDLIIRVERCVSGSNVPTLALVTYARLVIARCKELLDKVLHEPANDAVSNSSLLKKLHFIYINIKLRTEEKTSISAYFVG
jgi:hypothetical protein